MDPGTDAGTGQCARICFNLVLSILGIGVALTAKFLDDITSNMPEKSWEGADTSARGEFGEVSSRRLPRYFQKSPSVLNLCSSSSSRAGQ